jgi:hypothetical protein
MESTDLTLSFTANSEPGPHMRDVFCRFNRSGQADEILTVHVHSMVVPDIATVPPILQYPLNDATQRKFGVYNFTQVPWDALSLVVSGNAYEATTQRVENAPLSPHPSIPGVTPNQTWEVTLNPAQNGLPLFVDEIDPRPHAIPILVQAKQNDEVVGQYALTVNAVPILRYRIVPSVLFVRSPPHSSPIPFRARVRPNRSMVEVEELTATADVSDQRIDVTKLSITNEGPGHLQVIGEIQVSVDALSEEKLTTLRDGTVVQNDLFITFRLSNGDSFKWFLAWPRR